jgi:hypothetical protein
VEIVVIKLMNKYQKWEKILDEYYKTTSREQIYQDAQKAGIILEPLEGFPMVHQNK